MALSLLSLGDDDDDLSPKSDNFFMRHAEYFLRRFRTEFGSFEAVRPDIFVKENRRLLQSPAATMGALDNIMGLINLAFPYNWDRFSQEVTSGRYKGKSKAYQDFMRTLPVHKHVYNFMHPEEAIHFYKTHK